MKVAILLGGGGLVAIAVLIAISHTMGSVGAVFGERRIGTILTTVTLITSGVGCLRIRRKMPGHPFGRFWFWAGCLFILAGLDDLLRIHEEIDRAINRMMGIDIHHPIADHLDDVIVLGYVLPSLILGWNFRRQLMQLVLMIQVMAVAAVCFLAMVAHDMSGWSEVAEESLKLYAAILILIGILAAWYDPRIMGDEAKGSETLAKS